MIRFGVTTVRANGWTGLYESNIAAGYPPRPQFAGQFGCLPMACSAAERAEPAVRCQLIPWAYESAAERAEPAVRCQLIPWAYESAAERAEPARTTTTVSY